MSDDLIIEDNGNGEIEVWRGLNHRQQLFCIEYLVDLNQTAAAIRAGYDPDNAGTQAWRLMQRDDVRLRIQELMDQRAAKALITPDYVLNTILETIEKCKQARPVLNKKGKQVYVETEDGQELPAFTFDAKGVMKGAELLGKHLKLFTDVTETRHTFTQMPTVEIGNAANPDQPRVKLTFDIGSDPDQPPSAP